MEIVDNLKQFFPTIIRGRKDLAHDYIDLSNQFPLDGAVGRFVLAAAVKDHLLPRSFIPLHLSRRIMTSQSLAPRRHAVAVKAENCKVSYAVIAPVAIDMVYLDMLSTDVADAASVIVFVQNLVRDIGGYRYPRVLHSHSTC
jgi:hypothetical protein